MELPATIKINGYDILLTRCKEQIDHTDPYGEWNESAQEIKLREKFPSRYLEVDSVLHELFHACFFAMHISSKDEEKIVTALASSTMAIMRDNPALFDYLMAKLRP